MSRFAGVAVACGFATVWGYHGLSSSPGAGSWAYLPIIPSALIIGRTYMRPGEASSVEWDKVKKRYFTIVGIELLAMIVVTNIVTALRHPELIWPAIAVIVGLHFIPLARLFGSRAYYGTAAVLTALRLLAPVLLASRGQLILGMGAALTLWATALFAHADSNKSAELPGHG
jgi:hypothetical protein